MDVSRRSFLTLAGAALVACALPLRPARGAAPETLTLSGPAFGSYWRATLPARTDTDAAMAAIRAVVERVDMLMSPYRPDAETTRFSRRRDTDWVPLSPETARVVAGALAIARMSGGAFDPTVGPLVARYGFGPLHGAATGTYRGLELGPEGLRKTEPGLSLDLCGIAKGHALDAIAVELDALAIGSYLVDLGGEVLARGLHPSGRAWQVAIDRPLPGPPGLSHLVVLDDGAIATSGDAVQTYEIAGRRYGHIIDPARGTPATGALASVSVRAADATTADGLATGLFAMGLERAAAFAEAEGIDALLLARDGDGLTTVITGTFAGILVE